MKFKSLNTFLRVEKFNRLELKMSLKNYFERVFKNLSALENKMQTGFRFSQSEINEMISSARNENLQFFESLARMPELTAFDVSYLLSSVSLSMEKIEILKKASSLYKEDEFKAQGQTFSDFVFIIGANIDNLNMENLEVFKDLVQCKNELYDFSKALQNPIKCKQTRKKELQFAFQNVFIE